MLWCGAEQEEAVTYLLVVVRSQQEQQGEGQSYVGALRHVLVRHFALWENTADTTDSEDSRKPRSRRLGLSNRPIRKREYKTLLLRKTYCEARRRREHVLRWG